MEILHGCQFKNIHFLDRDTLWKRFDNGTSMALQNSNEGIWPEKNSNSIHGVKSAIIEIANLAPYNNHKAKILLLLINKQSN